MLIVAERSDAAIGDLLCRAIEFRDGRNWSSALVTSFDCQTELGFGAKERA